MTTKRSPKYAIIGLVALISQTFQVSAQSYDTDANAYYELQPQFINSGDGMHIYFNLEIWDDELSWSHGYDHMAQLNLSWDGTIFYRVQHNGLYGPPSLGSGYDEGHPSTTRYESPSAYQTYTLSSIADQISISYTNTVAYGGTKEVTQVHIFVPDDTNMDFQSSQSVSSQFQIYSYYYDRSGSGSSNEYAGTHTSQTRTYYYNEEDGSAVDELDFSVNHASDAGYAQISFRGETRQNEQWYDHLGCVQVRAENITKGTDELIAKIGHTSISCSLPSGMTTKSFSGLAGDGYSFAHSSTAVEIEEVKRVYSPTSWHYFEYPELDDDGYFKVIHYYNPEDFGDEIRYYITGTYVLSDLSGKTEKSINWWENDVKVQTDEDYTMPAVTGLTTTPSATDCEIEVSWDAYTSFGNPDRNRVALYRNGSLVALMNPAASTSYTDTDVIAGQEYSYQVVAEYVRDFNGRLKGNPSTASSVTIDKPAAPFALALTQGSCGDDITVDWNMSGGDPSWFHLQRKTSSSSFQTVDDEINGALRTYIDNQGIVSGEVYSYRIAAIGGVCESEGAFSDVITLTQDTLDISVSLAIDGLQTSKGYFDDRTELFWNTTGNNDQYLDRFRIYAREVNSINAPTLLATVPESDKSWQHLTGDAGTAYEYFIVGERVVYTECGNQVTTTFDIAGLDGISTSDGLPSNDLGVAHAVGFRVPTAIVNGNITYTGGVAVPNVKVVAEKYSGNAGNSLYFDGGSDQVEVPHSESLMSDTAFTISMWLKPEVLEGSVLYQKNGCYGLEYSGNSQKPFAFMRDTTGTAYVVSGESGVMKIGQWVNLTTTYSSATGRFTLYVNGEQSGALTVPEGLRLINQTIKPTYIGCQKGNSYYYQGYMDEVRFYNRALTAEEVRRTAGTVSATDATGLMGYWKFFVGMGDHVYDASHEGSSYHKNDGRINGAEWSTDIPSYAQLGYGAYTDQNGNYSIQGIGYSGTGENFNIIPVATLSGAVHEFDPSTRTLFIGEGNSIHNNIDFTDVSSFQVTGNVLFSFANDLNNPSVKTSGSEGVNIYLDGTNIIVNSNFEPFETDENGFFAIDVPIGKHYLEFRRSDHTFIDGGRFPASGTWDFQADVSGIEVLDTTLHVLMGRVVGGVEQGDKPIGMGRSKNNIGQARFTLTSEDGKIVREVITDSITGEYAIALPPKRYHASDVEYLINGLDIISSGDISAIDLTTYTAYQGATEKDSVFVNDTLAGIDSAFYHVRKDFIHRESPQLVVTKIPELYYASSTFTDSIETIDLTSLPFDCYKAQEFYWLKFKGVEIYQNADNASLDTSSVSDGEITINNGFGVGFKMEDGKRVPLGAPETISLDENGEGIYNFFVSGPNINEINSTGQEHLSFTQQMGVSLNAGGYDISWPNPADPQENYVVYVFGGKPIGNSFVTKSPEVVDFVLRDPPGSNSTAFKDITQTWSRTQSFNISGSRGVNGHYEFGQSMEVQKGAPVFLTGLEVSAFVQVDAELNVATGGGNEDVYETSFNTVFETNANPEQVGNADLYVAKSENLTTGMAVHIMPIELNNCGGYCYGDTMYSISGNAYRMGKAQRAYVGSDATPTFVVYSQAHIINVLIPDLEDIRNSFLVNSPKYTSKIAPDHEFYGTNNDDPVWGAQATSDDLVRTELADFDGPSYTFDHQGDTTVQDSVRIFNQQIRLWKEALADNEIAKWQAMQGSPQENISLASGVTLQKSITNSESFSKTFDLELSASISIGTHLSITGSGPHFVAEQSQTIGLTSSYSNTNTQGEEITTGYTLLDEDEDDTYSIDVYPGRGPNGPIFSIVGGQSMCPHEDEVVMQYTTVEYLQRQSEIYQRKIDALNEQIRAQQKIIDNPKDIDDYVDNKAVAEYRKEKLIRLRDGLQKPADYSTLISEINSGKVILSNRTLQRDKPSMVINGAHTAQAFNVPADQPANFTLTLFNESETNDNQYYAVEVLDGTNPDGLDIWIDGNAVVNSTNFWVPGGGAIQKILKVDRGPFKYEYENVGLLIHSTCQYNQTGNDALIADTVFFSVRFLPTCTDIEVLSPDNQWTVNSEFDNELPVVIGGYDVNSVGFERVKIQYKPSNSSNWTLMETYYRDSTLEGWSSEPTLPQNGNTLTHLWSLGNLPDGNYDIRAVATCALAESNSEIHSGVVDRLNPTPFGAPLPSDGILSPGEEISIQFNETINEGLLSQGNFDIRGVLNAGDIRHSASIQFDGVNNNLRVDPINLANRSFSFDFYAKRTKSGVYQVLINQGTASNSGLEIGFNASDQLYLNLDEHAVVAATSTDENWHHYAVTYNYETADAQIFVDANLDGVNNAFNANYTQNERIVIGQSTTGDAAGFEGNLHELRCWTKELSPGEVATVAVQKMVGNEPGLLHNWEMEEGRGSLAFDKVRGKHAEVEASWVVEPIGYSLRLNGGVDQAELLPVSLNGDADYTVELWFKSDGETDEVLLSNGTGSDIDANTSGWSIGVDEAGNVYAQSNDERVTGGLGNDGLWHHVALVNKAQGNAVLYMDAFEVGSIEGDSLNGFAGPALWIGQQGWYEGSVEQNAKQFAGNIDEIRIWNTARSFDQLDRDRYSKLSGDEPGLIEYYPFERYQATQGVTTVASSLNNASESILSANNAMVTGVDAELEQVTPPIKLERPVDAVNFTYVVNNDRIIITPNIEDWKIENVQLDFTVSGVQDLNGNTLVSPVTWSAYLDRNQVIWQDDIASLETEKGNSAYFVATILNNSGQSQAFSIGNVPEWLVVSPQSGSVGPLGTKSISITVPESVNNGVYKQDVLLTTDFGYAERLEVNVVVTQEPPSDWVVDPTQFQYSMNVVGQIAFNDQLSRNSGDLLGVFVNGECRGVGSLNYIESYDNFQSFLSIYSNQAGGEELEFRIWSAQTGAVHTGVQHNLSQSTFVADGFFGTSAMPLLFNATNFQAAEITIPKGWKWISFNLEGPDLDSTKMLLANLEATENDILKTRINQPNEQGDLVQKPYFDTYSNDYNWSGSITDNGGVQTNVLYKINSGNSGLIKYQGELVIPSEDTLKLVQDWNYIGYVGNENVSLSEGLSNYQPTSGDVIKSQYQSAIYDPGMGWLGSLATLEPAQGYMIRTGMSQSFTYPDYINGYNKKAVEAQKVASPWELSQETFASNMTLVAQIANDVYFDSYHSNTGVVGAFVNGKCRGTSQAIYHQSSDSYVYVLTVGGLSPNEIITFKYMDTEANEEFIAMESANIELDGVLGTLDAPVQLTLSTPLSNNGSLASKSRVSIFPNPLSEFAFITIELPTETDVRYIVEDISGRVLVNEHLGSQPAGVVNVKFQKGDIPAGLYLLRVFTGDVSFDQKIVITK